MFTVNTKHCLVLKLYNNKQQKWKQFLSAKKRHIGFQLEILQKKVEQKSHIHDWCHGFDATVVVVVVVIIVIVSVVLVSSGSDAVHDLFIYVFFLHKRT